MMDVNIANVHGAAVKTGTIKKTVRKMLKDQSKDSSGVNVIVCDDGKILELNRRFRQVSKPTDILSFPFDDSDLLGEIYISADTAVRQAQQAGHTLDAEIHRLIVHGTAHLLGFDHQSPKQKRAMGKIESQYL